MPLGELIAEGAEHFLRNVLGRVFLVVFYPLGWLILKALTLGRYPPHSSVRHNREAVAVFALVLLMMSVTVLYS